MSNVARAVGVRLAYGIPVFFLVTFGMALLVGFMPGSPAQAILGENAPPEAIAALNERYGFNLPPLQRYFDWLSGLVRLDLGTTLFTREPVLDVLGRRLIVTVQIA